MPGSNAVRVGIAGLGRAGWHCHCRELADKESMFRIVAGCDVLGDRRDRMAARYGCRTYGRIEDLAADPDVEMVIVATRSCDHVRHALSCLEAGKLVFLEKPMSLTYAGAKRLQAAADGRLFVCLPLRFEPEFQHIREIIAAGVLGEAYQIKLRRWTYWRRNDWQMLLEYGGGQLGNWGVLLIDHALQFLECPVKSIWSRLKRIAAVGDAEDFVRILLTGENDRIVDIEVNGGAALGGEEYLVLGTKGALRCTERKIHLRHLEPNAALKPRPPRAETLAQDDYGKDDNLQWVETTIPVSPAAACDTTTIWDALYAAVRQGVPFPITLDEAVEGMRVVSEVKASTPFAFAED